MKTKFMSAAVALAAALTLILGVAFPGALPSLPAPTAQAQDRSFTIAGQQKYTQKGDRHIPNYKIPADQLNGGKMTLGAGTVVTLESSTTFYIAPNSADFTVYYTGTDGGWYETKANYKKVSGKKYEVTLPEITIGGTAEIEFKGVHRGPPSTVISAKFDVVGGATQPDPEPGTSVTPAAPTAVDPATAPTCVEKGYINIPNTPGVDYYVNEQLKPSGQQFYEGKTAASVKVTAKAKAGYQIASGAQTEWAFEFFGQVKDCSGNQPTPPGDSSREFKATGHDFSLQGNPVDPRKPDTFTAKVGEDSRMKYATVRIKTDASFLDWQHYQLTVDKIEDGVTLQKRNLNIGNGYITMKVVPVKDGEQVDSAFLPKDAVFTFTNNLSENKQLAVELDVYGTKATGPEEPPIISPPDGATWVNGRVQNPQLPMRCGLRVALVVDLSTSLRYADSDGFTKSKEAANAFIDALAGTPAELGIYNFATTANANPKGTTIAQHPPYISMQAQDGVNQARQLVSNWQYNSNNSATNWQAGLNQVKDRSYDVVYFITDGMPTTSSTVRGKGISGEFVQASALNDAINAANDLKKAGTRVVPLMVDLTLGGNTGKNWVVQQDIVLKDIKRVDLNEEIPRNSGIYFRTNSGVAAAREANYNDKLLAGTNNSGELILVNLERAMKLAPNQSLEVFERRSNGSLNTITSNQKLWTYGPRSVTTMGEDISGKGDTVRVEGYAKLTEQMNKIAQDLTKNCAVTVKKRIVDVDGNVLRDGEPGWEFTLSANQDIIDLGNGNTVRQSLKATSSDNSSRGTASWSIKGDAVSGSGQSLQLVETQQPGYSLYKRDNKNAVCTETRDGKTTSIPVDNVGEYGFRVQMNKKDGVLSRVSCVVDNYQPPAPPKGKLTFKKAEYKDGRINELSGLGGATFEVYPSKEGKPDYSAAKPLYTIQPGQESIDVYTTGTFFLVETKAPQGLNLLAQPVQFEISIDPVKKLYKVSPVGTNSGSSGQIQASGLGTLMVLTVADTKSGELPKTGGYGVGLVGLIGAALAGAGLILGRRRFA